ncbi:MAG: hypothetical protein J7578_10615 [Chitinophagaceae bacterium]|nr:hypothetical protein [Chitinophagaceae bacterium]
MATEFDDKKMKAYITRRSIMDIGMGFIYAVIGCILAFSQQLGFALEFPPAPFSYIFGGLCLLYGGFRIYRGIKKNYYQ